MLSPTSPISSRHTTTTTTTTTTTPSSSSSSTNQFYVMHGAASMESSRRPVVIVVISLAVMCALVVSQLLVMTNQSTAQAVAEAHISTTPLYITETETSTTTSSSNHQNKHHNKKKNKSNDETFPCFSLDDDLKEALEGDVEQTILLMAAKVGGSSLKVFASECMGDPNRTHHIDNFINTDDGLMDFLLSSLRPPKLVASHLDRQQSLLDLLRYSSGRKTLIIYAYREESDRLMSAINFVVQRRLCRAYKNPTLIPEHYADEFEAINLTLSFMPDEERDQFGNKIVDSCRFAERPFLEHFVQKRFTEIGFSVEQHLGCDLWEEINETGPPRFLFVHYTQLDVLQAKLAAHYCPDVESKRSNVLRQNVTKYYVQSESGEEHNLTEWLDAKRHTMEFVLKTSGGSCKHQTRRLEDAMASCPDQTVRVRSTADLKDFIQFAEKRGDLGLEPPLPSGILKLMEAQQ